MSLCTTFVTDGDPELLRPCRCPRCKGFLSGSFPLDKQFLCRKCGAVLETMPPLEEWMRWDQFLFDLDLNDYRWGGRICLVPELAIKISTVLPPRAPKRRRKKTKKWAMGAAFSRRVWKDKDGEFIEIDGERLEISDPRILKIVEGE